MRTLASLGAVASLCLTSAACTAILGGFEFGSGGTGGTGTGGTGGTSTSSTGGGGASTSCEPLTQKACYDGDPTTLQGACHAGKMTCKSDGSGYGDCKDQLLPAAEDDCVGKVDTTCDGKLTCACTPKSTEPCYEGTPGTDAHLPCKAGTRTCLDDGSGYGGCVGQVTPAATDDCSTQEDENCDGVVNDLCTCQPGQSQACYTGKTGTENVGNCHGGTQACNATGTGWEACTGEVVPQAEQCDVVGDEDCDGIKCSEPLWVDMFPIVGTESTGLAGLAVDAQGDTFLSFSYEGGVDFGNGISTSNVQGASVLAKIAPDGKALWKVDGVAGALATDSWGNVYVSQNPGLTAISVSSYDKTGTFRWTKSWSATTGAASASGIVHDKAYGVIVVGQYTGNLSFGNGALTLPTANAADGFVVKIADSSGNPVWAQRVTDGAGQPGTAQYVAGIACDAGSQIFVTGNFITSVAIGGQSYVNTGNSDFYVAKLDGASGAPVWLKTFGGPGGTPVSGIALDAAGAPLIVGTATSGANFGGPNLTSHGKTDAFLLKLDAVGAHQWSKLLGGDGDDMGQSAAIDASDNVILSGYSWGTTLDLGGATLAAPGAFVAKFNASGTPIWSKSAGDGYQDPVLVRALPGSNDFFLTIRNFGTIDLGTGQLTTGTDNVILARFQP